MGNFEEAVAEWNRRHKEDGWRSSFAPQLVCPSCKREGMMLTTIYGYTRAECTCGHTWKIA